MVLAAIQYKRQIFDFVLLPAIPEAWIFPFL
jgi:hypothetical protein